MAFADPLYGGTLMLTYWLGRTLPVWLAPMLNWSGPDSSQLTADISAVSWLYHRLAGFGLVWSGVVVAWLAFEGLSGN